jgi:hypothetical protein
MSIKESTAKKNYSNSYSSKGGGKDISKVGSDKTKKEAKKYEKRSKAASKFVKNQGRSFYNIMAEKYRP